MKENFLLRFLTIMAMSVFMISCSSSRKVSNDSGNQKETTTWYNSREWLNGLQLKPHESINQQEFSRQYHLNKTWWDEAFHFLKTHDLENMQPGSYLIDTGNVIATISEVSPKDKEQVNWEAHRNFNDLQYIISGKAQMGIASIDDPKKTVTVPYNPKTDTESFSVTEGEKYYAAEPRTFFIFTPKEIHRPAFKETGYDTIKKIVIKVRVPRKS